MTQGPQSPLLHYRDASAYHGVRELGQATAGVICVACVWGVVIVVSVALLALPLLGWLLD